MDVVTEHMNLAGLNGKAKREQEEHFCLTKRLKEIQSG